MRVFPIVLLFVALGCDRGPTPSPSASSTPSTSADPHPAGDTHAAPLAPGVHGGATGLPPGHPPTPQNLPPGHPPTAGAGAAAPTGSAGPAFDPAHPIAGGITWTPVEPLRYRAPSSSMRVAEYVVGDDTATVMGVFFFPGMGGSVQDNVDRWVNQFTQPDGRPSAEVATTRQLESHGLAITLVDISGDFGGGMGAPSQTGQRLLGAIVDAPNGPVFFKLSGDAAAVEAASSAFERMLESVAPAS